MKKLLRLILIILIASPSYAQNTVTGVVKDSDGGTIIGAIVLVKDTQVATVTDANGQFTIPAQKTLPFTLRVRLVGFKQQEIEIYELDNELLEITLVLDNVLNEVVVTSRRREES